MKSTKSGRNDFATSIAAEAENLDTMLCDLSRHIAHLNKAQVEAAVGAIAASVRAMRATAEVRGARVARARHVLLDRLNNVMMGLQLYADGPELDKGIETGEVKRRLRETVMRASKAVDEVALLLDRAY